MTDAPQDGRKIVIVGTTDFARIAAVYLDTDSPYEVVAFSVDEEYIGDEKELVGRPIVPLEKLAESHPPSEYAAFVGIGFSGVNKTRADMCGRVKEMGYELISYVSSRATLAGEPGRGRATYGENCFIFEENTVQPFVEIGDDVILWSGNHIGHDSKIGDHCFIASEVVVSGNCEIGPYCFVGVNATFRDGITIGPRCVIGAAALVMKDAEEGTVLSVRGTEPFPKKSWEIRL